MAQIAQLLLNFTPRGLFRPQNGSGSSVEGAGLTWTLRGAEHLLKCLVFHVDLEPGWFWLRREQAHLVWLGLLLVGVSDPDLQVLVDVLLLVQVPAPLVNVGHVFAWRGLRRHLGLFFRQAFLRVEVVLPHRLWFAQVLRSSSTAALVSLGVVWLLRQTDGWRLESRHDFGDQVGLVQLNFEWRPHLVSSLVRNPGSWAH